MNGHLDSLATRSLKILDVNTLKTV